MKILSREISWLSFNGRVLQEASDKRVPLIERVRFLGIFSSNLDEFFRVRVATLRRMLPLGKKAKKLVGEHPKNVLAQIYDIVLSQQKQFEAIYEQIIDELANEGIHILNEDELSPEQGAFVTDFFRHEVRPALVPLMFDNLIEFPYLKDRAIYFAIVLSDSTGKERNKYALLEIPSDVVPRFLVLPNSGDKRYIVLLDDVIRYCLKEIFYIFKHDSVKAYTIKLTRDAELDIDDDINESLLEKISKSVKQRHYGTPVRLNYDSEIDKDLLQSIVKQIKLSDKKENLIPGGRYHNFRDFIRFPVLDKHHLVNPAMEEISHPDLPMNRSMLEAMGKKDVLLHYPYHSFDYFIELLREAAIDPKVESIKITLYRLAPKSKVGNALINAVKNGKKVTVVMELQARFDEEHNIFWSDKLREEGAKVFLGVQGLKVHSKACLITRREQGKRKYYANVSTGNYNEITSRLYADHSLFTTDERITNDLNDLFNFLESNYKIVPFKHIIVAPFQLRNRILELFDQEIIQARKGKPAHIRLKLNNLADVELTEKIIEAANAGVKIDMIIRSTCSVIPSISRHPENLRIISIVDKLLEHSRILIFNNKGKELVYITSADWMYRNLNTRVEMACPIFDDRIKGELKKYFDLQFSDNIKGRIINDIQDNRYQITEQMDENRSQVSIHKMLQQQSMTRSIRYNGQAIVSDS